MSTLATGEEDGGGGGGGGGGSKREQERKNISIIPSNENGQ